MPAVTPQSSGDERLLAEIARQLDGVRFGSVEILIHDGQAVAIERRERTRLQPPPPGGPQPR